MTQPVIIQGGMGVAVSDWRLARAVAMQGQLGVVSGTGINNVLIRRLQQGDPGGHMRRALAHFPLPELAQPLIDTYFIADGKPESAPFNLAPMYTVNPSCELQALTVVANFAEVFLAKEGHSGLVGINLMEKIQLPNLMSLYGAMLAGVDYVLMGAGIPREIPGILDQLAAHQQVSLKLHVEQASADDDIRLVFDPQALVGTALAPLKRPYFLPIVASATLALSLAKKSSGRVDGFIVEGPTAGGHNAPPRGALQLNERGEPIYGPRDAVDLNKIKELGLPFWLAGAYAHPDKLQQALDQGAAGIQVGTVFALCAESGLRPDLKRALIQQALAGDLDVRTDPAASPTSFPFKVARLADTLSEPEVYALRPRQCDLGYLRVVYKRPDGQLGYRCPAEPVDAYLKKGGDSADTAGRKCLCNGLMANIDVAQVQKNGYREQPLVTLGDDVSSIPHVLAPGATSYSAKDVIEYLLAAVR